MLVIRRMVEVGKRLMYSFEYLLMSLGGASIQVHSIMSSVLGWVWIWLVGWCRWTRGDSVVKFVKGEDMLVSTRKRGGK